MFATVYQWYQGLLSRYRKTNDEIKTLTITDLPEEVLTHNLLPLLQPNDVVRLRRVCKKLKSSADDHLRLHVRTNTILIIGECEDIVSNSDNNQEWVWQESDRVLMKDILSLNCHLPMSQLSLCFDDKENIFEDDSWKLQEFLTKYGNQITHLTMSTISMPMNNQKEISFYEGLPNLTHLTIMEVRPGGEIGENEEQEQYHFPMTFKTLKSLAVECVIFSQRNDVAVTKYFWTLVGFCADVETFVYPRFWNSINVENLVLLSFHHVAKMLQNGRLQYLKYYHLNKVSKTSFSAMGGPLAFADFCKVCNQYNVKLHVMGFFLDGLDDAILLEQVGRSIVSLKFSEICNLKATFPNLEYLNIYAYNDIERPNWAEFTEFPLLPKLQRLVYYANYNNPFPSNLTFYILFEAMRRPSVKSLEFYNRRVVPAPMLEKVAWSCFNLRTVQFACWNGTNEEMCLFWEKLPLLEEVALLYCENLEDSAFIGKDVNNPIFLRLKNLRKLSLIYLHKMTKITDALFKLVIRHLQLRELYITSWEPGTSEDLYGIYSITKEGIKSLLTSDFSKTIEKFPFDSWKLSDMSETEFLQLRDQFRSSQML